MKRGVNFLPTWRTSSPPLLLSLWGVNAHWGWGKAWGRGEPIPAALLQPPLHSPGCCHRIIFRLTISLGLLTLCMNLFFVNICPSSCEAVNVHEKYSCLLKKNAQNILFMPNLPKLELAGNFLDLQYKL